MGIQLVHNISVSDYNKLREAVGWTSFKEEQAKKGLENTYYMAVAKRQEQVVGIVRLISDGGYIALITDVIVHPEHQGYGIGRMMIEDVMAFIHREIGQDKYPVMINLMAAQGKEEFYKKFGFISRPDNCVGAGMYQWINC